MSVLGTPATWDKPGTSATTYSFSYTVVSGATRIVMTMLGATEGDPAVTVDGNAATRIARYADGGVSSANLFEYAIAGSGQSVTIAISDAQWGRGGLVYSLNNSASTSANATGVSPSANATVTVAGSDNGDLMIGGLALYEAQTYTPPDGESITAGGTTTRYSVTRAATGSNQVMGGTGSLSGSTSWSYAAASFPEPILGPTIDTQPEADVVLINGDPTRASASYTVAATASGGSLSYDWELEETVGGGTYVNVPNGAGLTWSGADAATLTAVVTAKTQTGKRVRCNVTDSNGTTTTDAVLLTIYTGPVLSKSSGTTNGSGVDTLTITSDYPNGVGEFTVTTATSRGITETVSQVFTA